jgi:dihydroflavonol-4-reductase
MPFVIASFQRAWARLSGTKVLLSMASARLLAREAGRTRFSSEKSERELGLKFRPVEETVRDAFAWFRAHRPYEVLLTRTQVPAAAQTRNDESQAFETV